MTGKLTARSAESLAKRKGRWLDGGGLFLRVLEPGHKVYWTYRFRLNGKDREMSVGSYPAMSLAEARIKHAELRAGPQGDRPGRRPAQGQSRPPRPADADLRPSPTATSRPGGRLEEPQASQQWRNDAGQYAAWFRDLPVDEVDAKAVLQVLEPKWREAPETMSRLRGRIRVCWPRLRSPVTSTPTSRIRQGGRTGSTICCQRRRRSARAAIMRRWIIAICPPSWPSSARRFRPGL